MKKMIYLDYAAATPMDKRVLEAMQPYFTEQFYNPSATYLAARKVATDVQMARAKVAHWLGSTPAEIVFTAGGTEANNLAIHGVMQQYPGANVVVSAIEHDSVLKPASEYEVRVAPVNRQGIIDLKKLEQLIDDQTVLVSIMYANNEIGTIQPLREISQLIKSKVESRKSKASGIQTLKNSTPSLPLWLHTDACQAAAYLDLHVHHLGVDLMTLNGGKIYGPKQSGVLFVGKRVRLKPQIVGGGQERGYRSGTENVAGSIGFAAALDLVQNRRGEEVDRLQQLQLTFFRLLDTSLPAAVINGSKKHRLPNNIHLTLPGQDNERLMMQLDEAGVLCAVGSACSASNEEPSHVLRAIGLSDEQAQASLRFTMGIATTEADLVKTVQALQTFARQ